MATEEGLQASFSERYASGEIPWDEELPPPEVISLAEELPPGRVLDLGCGYGRASIYLARRGWQAHGVDFVEQAVIEASIRAETAGVAQVTKFYSADVTKLDFISGPYDLAVDVGCMHILQGPQLIAYHEQLLRLQERGSIFLLFAHLNDPDQGSDEERRWISEDTITTLFAKGYTTESAVHGVTKMPDKPAWRSAWFRFRRV